MSAYVTPAGPLRAIVGALVTGGVRDVVICPGSRSTPLALALYAEKALRHWIHLDERAGAFFALGAARATGRPVAVLATSGTASVEFAPAVAEARYGRVPLLLLTADRPPELHGIGAPQTIDQVELYGRHAKWYAGLAVPTDADEAAVEARSTVERALSVASSAPAGPVQLNMPFREPLLPVGSLAGDEPGAPRLEPPAPVLLPVEAGEQVVRAARRSARPLLVSGPLDRPGFAAALSRLATALDAPIVADALANVRAGGAPGYVVGSHQALVRLERFRTTHRPDLVVRFGATPTSRVLGEWLEGLEAPTMLVDDGAGWDRPLRPGRELVMADPVAFADMAAEAVQGERSADPGWRAGWIEADRAAATALDAWFERLDEPFEGAVARALPEALPADAVVVVGNSMPVRDLDAFLPTTPSPLRFIGNRGANGIDGLLSTTFGAGAGLAQPVVGIVGDLSFLHDLTALAAGVRLGLDATLVLVDNDGGGIFSFLPQAREERSDLGLPRDFETLFGTPHGLDLGPVIRALGARHAALGGGDLPAALEAAFARPGVDVLHLRTERSRNVALHQAAFAAVAAALGADR